MPWRETDAVNERLQFIAAYQRGVFTMTDLCEQFGVARKTGYKLLRRYATRGSGGLDNDSRRPAHSPTATSQEMVRVIVGCRQRHPHWGPKKLVRYLQRQAARRPAADRPQLRPGLSTVARILAREGLTQTRGRGRQRSTAHPAAAIHSTGPNDLWTADYKGQFRTGDGHWCYPLTVMDHFSRFLLRCEGFPGPTDEDTRRAFSALFATYGLPERLRTDNGTPFAGPGLGGLSPLSVWWIRLGIVPERIDRGHPEQNPEHERMHKTLKAETARPPGPTLTSQQQAFDRFRVEYNDERPHEALAFEVPAALYRPSLRPMPACLPPLEYPGYYETRRVYDHGDIAWHGRRLFLSEALRGEYVGFEEVEDGVWDVWLAAVRLGRFHQRYWSLCPVGPLPE
jgi:putative transposase